MNCEDYLHHRSGFAPRRNGFSPQEIEGHLASCRECARLEEYVEAADMESVNLDYVQSAIESAIRADLKPVTPIPAQGWRALILVATVAAVAAVAALALGAHGWEGMSALQGTATAGFLTAITLSVAITVSAQMTPGAKQRFPVRALLASCLLCMPALALSLYPSAPTDEFAFLAVRCWAIGMAAALFTAVLLWMSLKRGFPLNLPMHAISAGMLAGLAGMAVLELHCPLMDAEHKAIGHGMVALTAMLSGAAIVFSPRKYRTQP